MTPKLALLPAAWRERAQALRPFTEAAAIAFERAADELEATLAEHGAEVLTLDQAALESGYTADHLARLVRSGHLPNAGRKHAPRLKRCDLPRKAHAMTLVDASPSDIRDLRTFAAQRTR